MRWILLIVAALAALVAIVVVVGALLPQNHVAARRVRLSAPPDRVFAVISDVGATASWRKDISSIDMLPAEGGNTMFREQQRGGDAVTYRVEALEPPRRMLVRIADTGLPFGGTWTYEVAPASSGGSEVTITERGEVYNPVFRFMSRFVFSHYATIDGYLRALGTKLGEAEPVAPESVTAS